MLVIFCWPTALSLLSGNIYGTLIFSIMTRNDWHGNLVQAYPYIIILWKKCYYRFWVKLCKHDVATEEKQFIDDCGCTHNLMQRILVAYLASLIRLHIVQHLTKVVWHALGRFNFYIAKQSSLSYWGKSWRSELPRHYIPWSNTAITLRSYSTEFAV